MLNRSILDVFKSYFDYEHEDQPEFISDYKIGSDAMWSYVFSRDKQSEMEAYIIHILSKCEDAATTIGFNFLPGRHEVEDILRFILENKPPDN